MLVLGCVSGYTTPWPMSSLLTYQVLLPMSSLRDLMQCEGVGSVAWFVHECMERVDSSHTG
jgi:hypothetical protein